MKINETSKGRINKLDKAIKYSISFISSENLPLFCQRNLKDPSDSVNLTKSV